MNLDYDAFYTMINNPEAVLSDRDVIFKQVLDSFNGKSLEILQVGAIETFNSAWAHGSGWSDVIFSRYIKKYGGILTVVDIDLDHIANSLLLSNMLRCVSNLIFMHKNAIDIDWSYPYNIYYLDGSNDPAETYFQYQKIPKENCVILVDDFYIKGTMLRDEGFTFYNIANGFGLKDYR